MAKRRSSRKKQKSNSQDSFLFRPEVVGLTLLGLSLLTLLSLFSATRGTITDGLITALTNLVGWGKYIIWFFFGSLGLWFIRRYGAEDDDEKWEKPLGTLLLLAIFLTAFQLISPADDLFSVNNVGGGGFLGWVFGQLLVEGLGLGGTIVILLLLTVLAAVLISGISLRELLVLGRDLYYNIQDRRHFRNLPINQSQPSYNAASAGPVQTASRTGMLARLLIRQPRDGDGQILPGQAPAKPRLLDRLRRNKDGRIDEDSPPIISGPLSAEDNAVALAPTTDQLQSFMNDEAADTTPVATPESALTTNTEDDASRKWHLPIMRELLDESIESEISEEELRQRAKLIEDTLASFGVEAKVREINPGPAVTQFSVQPGYLATRDAKGNRRKVRVSKIVNLSNDLALALEAAPIRIEAPIPGRPYVGIEVPNIAKATVTLRSIADSPAFHMHSGVMPIGLGRDVSGNSVVVDLTTMPHLLIAGATGSGKSVCINAIVACLLCTHTPDTLRMLMIDPKMVELINYNGIPHLIAPVVTELERVIGVLNWATREMDRRYKEFSKVGARNITSYNKHAEKVGEEKLPYIVIIIDELADLMMMAPEDVERAIARIAQMARATGMHLILATQRPSVDVVTGLIKANFPARIAFAVSSQIDSRVILDSPGAERLLGKGDMLYMAPDSAKLQRLLGVWVSEPELERIIKFWGGGQGMPRPSYGPVIDPGPLQQQPLIPELAPPTATKKGPTDEELLEKAIDVVKKHDRASISLLQRRLRIGYARAARLIDELEEQGIIGPDQGGGQARQILDLGGDEPSDQDEE
ncbi:MAG: DNA translocase FtsK [Chloroflexota bacterium]